MAERAPVSFGGPPSWSVVNLVLPLKVGEDGAAAELFAYVTRPLPRVPSVGEQVAAMGFRIEVERVLWNLDGRVLVRLDPAQVRAEDLETLEREGWQIAPKDEPTPPEDWFN